MVRSLLKVTFLFVTLITIGCGGAPLVGEEDETDEQLTSATDDDDDDPTISPTAGPATLALAFPSVELSSAFIEEDSTSLHLAEAGEDLEVVTEAQSPEEKQEQIDESLESETIGNCFNLALRSFEQPGCFAPNLRRTTWAASQSSYVVTLGSSVDQLLYGDGGIVTAIEGTESCTSATINFFVEGAISIVDQGKEIFASLVCASKFADVELPNNETTDYMSILSEVDLPDGVSFEMASMTHESAATGEDIYTTQLQIDMEDGDQTMYAYFRTQPEDSAGLSKGHAVVFHAGIADPLEAANSLHLNTPAPGMPTPGMPAPGMPAPGMPAPGMPAPGMPAPAAGTPTAPPAGGGGSGGGSDKIAAVSVAYQTDGTTTRANLYRADFVASFGTNHPSKFITANGALDHSKIAKSDAGHGIAANVVDASFVQSTSGTSAGQGIVGWTASYNDSFWRSFAYTVDRDSAGAETAKSTFGFAKSWVATEEKVYAPSPALGMFCAWAQNFGSPSPTTTTTTTTSTGKHLTGSGLSGTAQNLVQLQVSTRTSADEPFAHSAASSYLNYEITSSCGDSTVNNLVTVESDGSVTGQFAIPVLNALTPLGGVSLDSSAIDLSID